MDKHTAIQVHFITNTVEISETQRVSKIFAESKQVWMGDKVEDDTKNWIVFPNQAYALDKTAPEYILVQSPTASRQDILLFKELCTIFGSSLQAIYALAYNDAKNGKEPRV